MSTTTPATAPASALGPRRRAQSLLGNFNLMTTPRKRGADFGSSSRAATHCEPNNASPTANTAPPPRPYSDKVSSTWCTNMNTTNKLRPHALADPNE